MVRFAARSCVSLRDSRITRCRSSSTWCCCSASARCSASGSTITDSVWSAVSSSPPRDFGSWAVGRDQGLSGRTGAGQHRRGVAVFHDPAMAAALVAAGLGACSWACSSCSRNWRRLCCSRSSTNSSRWIMKICGGAVILRRARRHARPRRVSLEAFGEKQEGECGPDRAGQHAAHHSGRHAARQLHARRNRSRAGSRTRASRAPAYSEKHPGAGRDHACSDSGRRTGRCIMR